LRPQPSRPEAKPEPTRLELSAPAKLNLGLRVLGRRPDGYHQLESLFVPIDLADEVEVEVVRGGPPARACDVRIDLNVSAGAEDPVGTSLDGVPADARNLTVIAARAFLQRAIPTRQAADGLGVRCVRIRLRKRIPVGAGLGGGSSDAGAVLRALTRLLPEGPSGAELARVALEVGADVPFFLDPRPAVVTGIGDEVAAAEGLPPLSLLLANPGVGVSTAEVYAAYDSMLSDTASAEPALTTPDPAPTLRLPSTPSAAGPGTAGDALSRLPACRNDLEAAAIRLCPPLASLRNRMHSLGATRLGMSGSGATLYGVYASAADASRALEAASFEPPIWARVARSLG
jgi:4-diphosphocytidyl-2-C-methyl-D-erythritol kinase